MELYKIASELERVEHALEFLSEVKEETNGHGEIKDQDNSLRLYLDSLEEQREQKIENIYRLVLNYESEQMAVAKEIARLEYKNRILKGKVSWLKDYVKSCIKEGEKVHTPLVNITWRKSKSVNVLDESKVPDLYLRKNIEVNKFLALEDMKQGAEIPGLELQEKLNINFR